jgi:hypothetical protein
MYFVYALVDPFTEVPAYVGITHNPHVRLYQHIHADDLNIEKRKWIQKLALIQAQPNMKILEEVDNEDQAKPRERYWIQFYESQGIQLTNIVHAQKIKKSKVIGWLKFWEIDEAWDIYLHEQEATHKRLEDFANTFSSPRLPILREKDKAHFEIWYRCKAFKIEHPDYQPSLP